MSDATPSIPLSNGVSLPQLGLGVFKSGEQTPQAVYGALDAGYRHIDTAHIYRNELEVGQGVRAWCADRGVPRSQVFVTTKLWNDHHGYDSALAAFDRSCEQLGLEYVDLYLLHWPVPDARHDSWRALERILREGRARAIGVSNFTPAHLRQLLDVCEVAPMVNQIELHPFLQQRETVALCRQHGIAVEAYSPLTKGRMLDDDVLVTTASRLGCSVAQLLIRWSLAQGHVVLPKSSNPDRIRENAAAVNIRLDDAALSALSALDAGIHTAWDPTLVP